MEINFDYNVGVNDYWHFLSILFPKFTTQYKYASHYDTIIGMELVQKKKYFASLMDTMYSCLNASELLNRVHDPALGTIIDSVRDSLGIPDDSGVKKCLKDLNFFFKDGPGANVSANIQHITGYAFNQKSLDVYLVSTFEQSARVRDKIVLGINPDPAVCIIYLVHELASMNLCILDSRMDNLLGEDGRKMHEVLTDLVAYSILEILFGKEIRAFSNKDSEGYLRAWKNKSSFEEFFNKLSMELRVR